MAKQDSSFFEEDEQDLYADNSSENSVEGEDPELASFFAQEQRQSKEKNKRLIKRRIEMQLEKRRLIKNIEFYDWD